MPVRQDLVDALKREGAVNGDTDALGKLIARTGATTINEFIAKVAAAGVSIEDIAESLVAVGFNPTQMVDAAVKGGISAQSIQQAMEGQGGKGIDKIMGKHFIPPPVATPTQRGALGPFAGVPTFIQNIVPPLPEITLSPDQEKFFADMERNLTEQGIRRINDEAERGKRQLKEDLNARGQLGSSVESWAASEFERNRLRTIEDVTSGIGANVAKLRTEALEGRAERELGRMRAGAEVTTSIGQMSIQAMIAGWDKELREKGLNLEERRTEINKRLVEQQLDINLLKVTVDAAIGFGEIGETSFQFDVNTLNALNINAFTAQETKELADTEVKLRIWLAEGAIDQAGADRIMAGTIEKINARRENPLSPGAIAELTSEIGGAVIRIGGRVIAGRSGRGGGAGTTTSVSRAVEPTRTAVQAVGPSPTLPPGVGQTRSAMRLEAPGLTQPTVFSLQPSGYGRATALRAPEPVAPVLLPQQKIGQPLTTLRAKALRTSRRQFV